MDARKGRKNGDQDKRGVRDSHQGSQPPRGYPERVEEEDVNRCDPPTVEKVYDKADDFGAVTIGRDHRPKQESNIHARKVQRMAGAEQRRQETGGEQSPEQHVADMHERLPRRSDGERGFLQPA
jgi:hypothetical protein